MLPWIVSLAISAILLPGASASDFCADPYAAICGHKDTSEEARSARVERVKERAKARALADVAKSLGVNPEKFTESQLWELGVPFSLISFWHYQSRIVEVIREETSPLELTTVLTNVERIKNLMSRAIDARLSDNWRDRIAGLAMREVVRKVRVVTHLERTVLASFGNKDMKSLQESFRDTCGIDGLKENAFASVVNGTRYVVFCPGWLIRAVGEGNKSYSGFLNILQVLGHELGHHIDGDDFPGAYTKYEACFVRHHANDLKFKSGTPAWLENALNATGKAAAYKTRRHLNEIAADYWGMQTLLQYLREEGSSYGRKRKRRVLREALSGSCGATGSDGAHPSDRFILETLLRRDPGIAEVMGCPSSESVSAKKGCTLEGATRDALF